MLTFSGITIGHSQVINEIYTRGGQDATSIWQDDAVVLKGPANQSLNGWSLQFAGSLSASFGTQFNFGAGDAFNAQGFFYIRFDGNAGFGAPLPASYVYGGVSNLSSTGGKLALTNNPTAIAVACPIPGNAAVIDFVGWGNANCFEGAAISNLTTSGNQSMKRTGADTGNNNNDFAINATALPVELASFTVTLESKKILLQWNTQSERNNDYFSIERSTDGRTFEAIGQVKGNGNSTSLQSYRYTDLQPKAGLNYYRLQQVDYDGKATYSEVISVTIGKRTGQAVLSPNPSNGLTRLTYNASTEGSLAIIVRDLSGRTVLQQTQDVAAGENTLSLNGSTLAKGTYLVEISTNDDTQVQKLVIQ